MPSANLQGTYLSRLASAAPRDHAIQSVILGQFTGSQRVHLAGGSSKPDPTLSSVLHLPKDTTIENTVCLIENISPEWMAGLGEAWDIDPSFFIDHASHPKDKGVSLWEDVMDSWIPWDMRKERIRANLQDKSPRICRQYHIKGILHHLMPEDAQPRNRFVRRFEGSTIYGWQSHTRISYYRVSEHIYLFLVDRPSFMELSDSDRLSPSKISLWVPYSGNRAVPIPQLYRNESPHNYFSMFESLQDFFSHPWQRTVLFATLEKDEAIDYMCLSYILLASLWLTNFRHLDTSIKKIAFKDIRNPTVKINNRLHDLRHDLDTLHGEVLMAKTYLIPELVAACDQLQPYKAPMTTLEEVYAGSANLERFLMDTFQLLMSSISVLDSQTSIQDAKRSSLLAQLATIYVPLSFVTGVFGMNVKEINDSPRSIWIFVVTLLVVGVFTVASLWLTRQVQNHGGWRNVASNRHRELSISEKDVRGRV